MPRISVIMVVKDGERYVREAVASMLGQTWTDFEMIVVDDGSTDATRSILGSFSDPRLRRIDLPANVGQPSALNIALDAAAGDLIARMDADDVALPARLATQAAALDARPDLGLVGARVETIGPDGAAVDSGFAPPHGEALVAWNLLLFTNPIAHPTVLFRRSLLDTVGRYDPAMGPAEDRDLWSRMFPVTRLDVVPDVLLRFRLHPASLSRRNHAVQREKSLAIRRRLLARYLEGDDPGSAIAEWYADRLTPAAAAALAALFRRVLDRMTHSAAWTPEQLAPVRADLEVRLASLVRRTDSGTFGSMLRRRFRR